MMLIYADTGVLLDTRQTQAARQAGLTVAVPGASGS
jgi:hypothetical protein